MTERLFDKDSFIKEFEATVKECEKCDGGYKILLDKTAFFPEAGGQKSDIGFLNEAKVLDVQEEGKYIYHFTDKEITVGKMVSGSINFERRFDFMQQHSAEHIVSGIANKIYGCENVGFHLSEDIVTLDFDKPLSREEIIRVETLSNEAVFNNKTFYTYYPDDETVQHAGVILGLGSVAGHVSMRTPRKAAGYMGRNIYGIYWYGR